MDRLKPIDLERPGLSTRMRGYDRSEVDALLQRAASELGVLVSELRKVEEESARQAAEIRAFKAQENTLHEVLILAQRTADETRASAHKESELILEQARQKAEDFQRQSQKQIEELRWELERLRLEKQRFINSFRNLLESHLRGLAESGAGLALVGADPEPPHGEVQA